MYKKIMLLFLYVLNSSICISQNTSNSILVYADKQDYLMPIIEKKLLSLRFLGKNEKIISNVTNLNRVTSSIASEIVLNQSIKYYSNINFPLSEDTKKVQGTIADLLLKNNLFLQVRVNTINNFLEFQLLLYKINNKGGFPFIETSNPISTYNIFINIEKEDYERKIEDAIKSLFPRSNSSPIAKINVEKYSEYYKYLDLEKRIEDEASEYKYDSTDSRSSWQSFKKSLTRDKEFTLKLYRDKYRRFYVPINENIQLSPFLSTDSDTPSDQLTYSWKNIPDNEHNLLPLEFKSSVSNNQLNIQFYESKSSLWELTVSDGVSTSKDIVEIMSIEKVILFIPVDNRQFWTTRQKSLFNNETSKYLNSTKINVKVYSNSSSKLDQASFLLSTIYFKIDTANLVSYKRTLNKLIADKKSKYYLPIFKTGDLFTTLEIYHINSSEGQYKIKYFKNGIISESNTFSIKNRYVGIFSARYIYNFSRIGNAYFNESEFSFSMRILRGLNLYASNFRSYPLKYQTLNVKNSNEFGFKFNSEYFSLSKNGKTNGEFTYGFYYRNFLAEEAQSLENKGLLGISIQTDIYRVLIKDINFIFTGGYKLGVQVVPNAVKGNSERRFYLGVGIAF